MGRNRNLEQRNWNRNRNRNRNGRTTNQKIRNDRSQELFPEHQQFSSCNLYIPDEFVINETSRKEDFTLLK